MATEIIEGSVAATEPVRSKWGYCLFDPLVVTDSKGGKRELRKVSAGGAVADAIRRGGKGRFYLSKNAGMAGIHGVRLDDGTNAYAKFHNFEMMFLIGIAAGLAMLVIGLVDPESFMITPIIVGAAILVGYFVIRSGRIADQKAFDGDAGR